MEGGLRGPSWARGSWTGVGWAQSVCSRPEHQAKLTGRPLPPPPRGAKAAVLGGCNRVRGGRPSVSTGVLLFPTPVML